MTENSKDDGNASDLFAAIRESPETFQELVSAAGDGILVADARTAEMVYANNAMAHQLGYTVEELSRIPFERIHPPPDLPWVREAFERMARGEVSIAVDIPMLRSDGRVVRFDVRTVRVEREGRAYLMGIFRDVSVIREARRNLSESQRQIKTLMENLPGMVYRCRNDRAWTMTFCSEGVRTLLGVESYEFLAGASSYNDYIHPEDREQVWREVQAALALEQPFELRYRIRTRGGEEKHIWEQGRGVKDSSGKFQGLEGFIMDVTPLVESTARAESLSRALELVMETTQSTAYENDLVTGDAGLRSVALFRAMGYAEDEVPTTAAGLSAIVHPEDMPSVWEAIDRHARGEIPKYYAEYRARAKDGSWWLIAGTGTITERTPDGKPLKLVGMATALRDRQRADEDRRVLLERERQARREAEEAVRVRDEFISVAAHELKTPLATLQIALDRLASATTPPPPSEGASATTEDGTGTTRTVEIARRQARRMVRLVNGLLDLTRLSTGRFELQREDLDLGAVVRDVVQRDEAVLAQAGCDVHVDENVPVSGHWDRTRIEQVVENLLSNAAKFGRGKPIEIRIGATEEAAILGVRDHGIGIPPGQEERIFDAYERGGSERHFGGLGMGLYISRAIVQAHGGHITVHNAPEGGAVFTVDLPIR